jgi:hypothetical protein
VPAPGAAAVSRSIAVISHRVKNPAPFVQSVANAMTGNASLPSPAPTLAIFKADIEALNTAEPAVLARTQGASAAPRMGGAPVRIRTWPGRRMAASSRMGRASSRTRTDAVRERSRRMRTSRRHVRGYAAAWSTPGRARRIRTDAVHDRSRRMCTSRDAQGIRTDAVRKRSRRTRTSRRHVRRCAAA